MKLIAPEHPSWREATEKCGLKCEYLPSQDPIGTLNQLLAKGNILEPILISEKRQVQFIDSWITKALEGSGSNWWLLAFEEPGDDIGITLLHPRLFGIKTQFSEWDSIKVLSEEVKRYQGECIKVGKAIQGVGELSKPRVHWQGPMFDTSGYGTDTRELVKWAPFELTLSPEDWGVRAELTPEEFYQLQRLTDDRAEGTFVRSGFPDHFEERTIRTIGRTMYELNKLPKKWRELVKRVDTLWVPTTWCQELFAQYHSDVRVIPCVINTDLFCPKEEKYGLLDNSVCRFLFVSEWIHRKGWKEMLEAFKLAFPNPQGVELVVKTFSFRKHKEGIQRDIRSILPEQYQVRRVEGTLTDVEMSWLYNSAHCLLHFSHGEGYGRTVAEMLACGQEVISHGETGLRDLQLDPVPGKWKDISAEGLEEFPQIQSDQETYQWIEMPLDALVEELRSSYQRWTEGKVRNRRDHIVQNTSGPVVREMMRKEIQK